MTPDIQATGQNFYGVTSSGGAFGWGTFFKMTVGGTLTTLYNFNLTEGATPVGALVLAANGNFYGAADVGGAMGYGAIFSITPGGTLTTLHSFDYTTDGANPIGGLIQAGDGNFYGTTTAGGTNGHGTVFRITRSGKLTTLHSFTDSTDGALPYAGLVQGTDGSFYGTTYEGGANGYGAIFSITSAGTLTTLHSFDTTGFEPFAGLVQATDGNFYGTTSLGGTNNSGTLFSLSVGLGPFVETLPHFGKPGAAVRLLGTNLTGTSSVSFNGVTAAFTFGSPTEITTNVPVGATTGKVQVITPGGLLLSGGPFLVRP